MVPAGLIFLRGTAHLFGDEVSMKLKRGVSAFKGRNKQNEAKMVLSLNSFGCSNLIDLCCKLFVHMY